jgi:hypothetical protein
MSESTGNVPPGWYPDPAGGGQQRWWDGTAWADHRQQPYSVNAAALKAPDGTKTNTPWIWLMVVLPLFAFIPLFFIDWAGMYDFDLLDETDALRSQFALFSSPWYIASTVGSWLVYGLCALFAFLDWRELKRREIPRPFHFAWTFLSSVVYVIGRSVVVGRRTGSGRAPMWGAIIVLAISLASGIYVAVAMISGMMASLPPYR